MGIISTTWLGSPKEYTNANTIVEEDLATTDIYREFSVVRRGWFNYEPVFICIVDGQPITYKTFTRFYGRLQATRVSMIMRSQYNDGLWEMNKHPLQQEEDYNA